MSETREKLLKILHDNKKKYISGEKAADRLGVSRTAVWKHIQVLRKNGYNIKSCPRRGYTLIKVPDKIIPEEIFLDLSTKYIGQKIKKWQKVDSTNHRAKILAEQGAEEGTVIIAEEQNDGQGRMGRKWYSPPGLGLWFSIVLRPDFRPDNAPLLTIVASLTVADVLEKYDIKSAIKWPNDILVSGKKVSGILAEMSADMDKINYAIVGIGINVNQDEFPDFLNNTATSVRLNLGKKINRNIFLQKLLLSFEYYYNLLLSGKREKLLTSWEEKLSVINKDIEIKNFNNTYRGEAVGVSENGALIVKTESGLKYFWAGEASLHQD